MVRISNFIDAIAIFYIHLAAYISELVTESNVHIADKHLGIAIFTLL